MQKIIARVLSRLGLESAIKAKVFDSGELIIASDTPRAVVGDGITMGGRSLSPVFHKVTDLAASKDAIYKGDIIFYKNKLYTANVSGYLQPSITLADFDVMSSEVDEIGLSRDVDGLLILKDGGITLAKLNTSLSTALEFKANKGIADGYAPLNSSAIVPNINLPTASTLVPGITEYATAEELYAGANNRSITPETLQSSGVNISDGHIGIGPNTTFSGEVVYANIVNYSQTAHFGSTTIFYDVADFNSTVNFFGNEMHNGVVGYYGSVLFYSHVEYQTGTTITYSAADTVYSGGTVWFVGNEVTQTNGYTTYSAVSVMHSEGSVKYFSVTPEFFAGLVTKDITEENSLAIDYTGITQSANLGAQIGTLTLAGASQGLVFAGDGSTWLPINAGTSPGFQVNGAMQWGSYIEGGDGALVSATEIGVRYGVGGQYLSRLGADVQVQDTNTSELTRQTYYGWDQFDGVSANGSMTLAGAYAGMVFANGGLPVPITTDGGALRLANVEVLGALDIRDFASVNFSFDSYANFNNGSYANFNNGSAAVFTSGSSLVFDDGSFLVFNSGSYANFSGAHPLYGSRTTLPAAATDLASAIALVNALRLLVGPDGGNGFGFADL